MVERNDWNTLPVDKGWAWAIAGAGFSNNLLIALAVHTKALLFVEHLQIFEATFTAVSLVIMATTFAIGISSVIVTNFILPKFSERTCAALGGFLVSLLTLCLAFVSNLDIFIAITAVKGIFQGLILVPSLALIPRYFKRYRSRASIIPFCGGSVGNIVGPLVISAARKEFGVRGVFILLSGLELHYCLCGLLLRPVSSYRDMANPGPGDGPTLNKEAEPAAMLVHVNKPAEADKSLTRWQTFYYSSSLQLWSLRWIMMSILPGTVVNYLINYVPTISKFNGCSFDQAGWLATIMGCVDLVGRMSFGFIVDAKILSASRLLVVSHICLGITSHLMIFATSFSSMVPIAVVIGMFMSCRSPLIILLCTEVVGAKNTGKAFSLALVLISFGGALWNPILGPVVEATGSFVAVLHIIGACNVLCAGLMACLPLFMSSDRKHGRRK